MNKSHCLSWSAVGVCDIEISFTSFGLNFAYPSSIFQFPRKIIGVASQSCELLSLLVIIVWFLHFTKLYKHAVCVLEFQLETWTILVAIVCILVFVLKEIVMGGKSSKGSGRRYDFGASSSSRDNNYGGYHPQSPYPSYQTPQHPRASAPFYDYGQPKRKLDKKYSRIADNYRSLDEVIWSLHVIVLFDFHIYYQQLFDLLWFCLLSLSLTRLVGGYNIDLKTYTPFYANVKAV